MTLERRNCLAGIAVLSLILALVACIVAFSTDHWMEMENQRSFGSNDRHELFTRHYGLFRECFPEASLTNGQPIDKQGSKLWENELGIKCFHIDFQLPRDNNLPLDGSEERYYDLLRATFSMMILGMIFFVVALLLLCFGYWWLMRRILKSSIAFTILAALVVLIAIILFHVRHQLETETLSVIGEEKVNRADYLKVFILSMDKTTQNGLMYHLSWSYAVAWVAIFLAIICAVIVTFIAQTDVGQLSETEAFYVDADVAGIPTYDNEYYIEQSTGFPSHVPPLQREGLKSAASKASLESAGAEEREEKFVIQRPSVRAT